jgi:xyloglucan-specific exo-beta-1,4-glucanase
MTPPSGLAVDLQKPGTVMVAALNCWWPDGNAFRTTDGGNTWTGLWDWASYPTMNRYYTYDDSLAPWLGPDGTADSIVTQIGWMMEALAIDPFDSNHWLYGTGATIYGGHDLLKWDTVHNITIKSLADGIEETSVQALLSPPTGPVLLSGVLDEEGTSLVCPIDYRYRIFCTCRFRAYQSYPGTCGRILFLDIDWHYRPGLRW